MNKRTVLIVAWVVTLLVSVLPNIILAELFKQDTAWLFPAKLGLLAVALLASLLLKQIRSLWMYFTVFLILYLVEYGAGWVGGLSNGKPGSRPHRLSLPRCWGPNWSGSCLPWRWW
jgi:hypothetical protein